MATTFTPSRTTNPPSVNSRAKNSTDALRIGSPRPSASTDGSSGANCELFHLIWTPPYSPELVQLVSLTRWYREKKSTADFKSETRYFITSLEQEDASHTRLAEIARGHWSIENKNHWKKDATLWREDRGGRRKAKGAKNLALLRNAILAIIPQDGHASLNQAFLHYADHRSEAIRLITQTAPCSS